MVDAGDSKSPGTWYRVGSIPTSGINYTLIESRAPTSGINYILIKSRPPTSGTIKFKSRGPASGTNDYK